MTTAVRKRLAPDERCFAKIDAFGDCWEWTGRLSKLGYGQFHPRPGVCVVSHKYVWETLVGPVPEGLELDHLCRNRSCCNPDHLEPVTHAENVRRAKRLYPKAAFCQRGHAMTGANVGRFKAGHRYCKTCVKVRRQAQYVKRERKVLTTCRLGHPSKPLGTSPTRRWCPTCNARRRGAARARKASPPPPAPMQDTTQPPRRSTPDRPLAIDALTPTSLLATLHRGYALLADLERHETVPASARLTPAQRAEWPLIAAELARRGDEGEGAGAWAA